MVVVDGSAAVGLAALEVDTHHAVVAVFFPELGLCSEKSKFYSQIVIEILGKTDYQ